MRRRLLGPILAAALATALVAAPASAKAPVQRRGLCEFTTTAHWVLNVQTGVVPKTLRVRFVVRGAAPGDIWQVLLSDGNHGLPAVDRVVGLDGAFRLIRVVHDRPRHDHFIVSANNRDGSGETCTGRVTF
jgi:hypothetical protein